jgi:chromosome segregation ATPase
MRDAGFRHLDNTEFDDQEAAHKLTQRPINLGHNMVAESGIIKSVTCYNFMCHERLHVELGPLINFIVGENGSGKSAVLTALTLCLGGKASDTNRGGSLRSFVKEGTDHGSLVVTIMNGGTDAYKPELYGDSITIERHFSKSGASGFKIKTSAGRIVTNKKQEVDEISEWYALQIGNPLTVLTQDNARQFLNSASPAQKYKYFVSGVQLEQLDNDYKMSQDMLDKTLMMRDDLDERIAGVKKEMEAAQRLAETASKNQSLREKRRHYRNQLIWSQVVMQERLVQEHEQNIAARAARIQEAEALCQTKAAALATVQRSLQAAQEARAALDEERGIHDEAIARAEAALDKAKKDVTDLQVEERDAYARLKNTKDEIRKCEEQISQEEQRLEAATGSARAEKDAELLETRSREREIENKIEEARQQSSSVHTAVLQAQNAYRRQQELKELKRKEILTAERQVRELEQSSPGQFDGFDKDIVNLADALQRDNSFQQRPIGPIGAHVRLLKPEWSSILEKTFGEALNAFVVRSKQDQTRLSNMMRQRRMKKPPQVFIASCDRIDTSGKEPATEFDTILRVLEFDNELLRAQLIISHQIEKIILVPQRTEAQRVMVENGSPPQNVAACLCFHDGKGKRGHGLRITNRGGGASTAPVTPNQGQRPRMKTDAASQIRLQKDALNQLGTELREITAEERLALAASQRCERESKNHKESIKRLETDLRHTQADIQRIEEELDAFEGVDDRLNLLRQQLELKRSEEENIGTQYGNMRLSKRDLQSIVDDLRRKYDAVKVDADDFQQKVVKAESKVSAKTSLCRISLTAKNEAHEMLDIERNEHQRAIVERDETQANVEDFTRQALEMSQMRVHVPDDETHESIKKKYDKVTEQLEQRRKRLGATDEEIYDRATEATERYRDVKKKTEDVDTTIELLKKAIKSRLELWRNFQRQISARVRIQFTMLLSERGFRGKINLDHKNRKVDIHIEPDETKKSGAGRNTKTLSGGEKSFSSICMLLSIWEAIGSPIRCLDEFDVFMDNVNRAISTQMLVSSKKYFRPMRLMANSFSHRWTRHDVQFHDSISSSHPTQLRVV